MCVAWHTCMLYLLQDDGQTTAVTTHTSTLGHDMECSLKWVLTMTPVVLIYLILGYQYTIIMPTIWEYVVDKFGAQEWVYSLSISCSSLANILFGPLFGALYDKTHATKVLVTLTIASSAIGSFLYFSAVSAYMVLAGRFMQGLSLAGGTIINGEIARITTRKERTAVYTLLSGVTQFGYVIGPGFNLFLRYSDFQLGPFKVDKCTAPGLFVFISWTFIGTLFIFCYLHLPTVEDKNGSGSNFVTNDAEVEMAETSNGNDSDDSTSSRTELRSAGTSVTSTQSRANYVMERSYIRHTETPSPAHNHHEFLAAKNSVASPGKKSVSNRAQMCFCCCSRMKYFCSRFWWVVSMLVWSETVALLYVIGVLFFCEMVALVSFVPLASRLFHWGDVPVSVFFSVSGMLMIVVSVFVSLISRKVSDRWTVIVSIIATLFGSLWLCGWLWFGSTENGTLVTLMTVQFVIGNIVICLNEPVSLGSAVSLFSKLLHPQVQGIGHGVRRSIFSLGGLLGSLWAGGALHENSIVLLYGMPIGLLLLAILLTVMSFRKLDTSRV